MAKKNEKAAEEPSFEDALDALESIVSDLDGGRLPLTELVGQYEEGTRLLKICRDRLADARGKIEAIDSAALEAGRDPLIDLDEAAATAPKAKSAKTTKASGRSNQETSDDEVRLF